MLDKTEACAVDASRTTCAQILARGFNDYVNVGLPGNVPGQGRILIEKIRDRLDTYDPALPAPGQLPSAVFSYRHSTANEYAYDGFGSVVMMRALGLVTVANPGEFNNRATLFSYQNQVATDDIATVTQYIYQGDETGMASSTTWRVGFIKSSQAYQTLPVSIDYALSPANPSVSGALTATRFCYDSPGATCVFGGAIGAGDITHPSAWLDVKLDALGNTIFDRRWLTSRTSYNEFGQVQAVYDLAGNLPTLNEYHGLNESLLSRITDALGQHSDFAYNAVGLLGTATDINNVQTVYEYDNLWRLTKTRIPALYAVPLVENRYCFGSNPTAGCVLNLPQYIETRNLLDVTPAAIYVESRSFFDGMLRTYATVAPAPDPTRFANGEGVWSLTFWEDDQGLQTDAFRPFAAPFGGAPPAAVPAGQPSTHQTYDLKKRVIQTDYPDGTRSITAQSGLTSLAVDGKNHWVMHIADGAGRLVEVRENKEVNTLSYGDYYSTRYQYDAVGRLTGVTDPNNQALVSNITFDSLGRKLSITDRDTKTTKNYFDDQGRLIFERDARNVETHLTYDTLNRVTGKTYSGLNGGAMPSSVKGLGPVEYKYGSGELGEGPCQLGRLKARKENVDMLDQRIEEFTYDCVGRPTASTRRIRVTSASGVTTEYPFILSRTYNAMSQVKQLTYPDGYQLRNDYGNNGVLLRTYHPGATVDQTIYFATFDVLNDVGQMTYGMMLNGRIDRQFEYDFKTGRPLSQFDRRLIPNDPQTVQTLSYFSLGATPHQPPILFYDEVGNIKAIDGGTRGPDNLFHDASQLFNYDDMNRLTQAYSENTYGTLDFGYDRNGNLTQKDGKQYTYDTNRLHAVASRNTISPPRTAEQFGYDITGNMTTAPGLTVKWDAAGRPGQIVHTKAGNNGQYDYTYDDGGGRVLKQRTGSTRQLDNYTRIYLGNLYEVQIERDGSDTYFTHTKHIFAGTQRVSTITESAGGVLFAANITNQYHEQTANALASAITQSGSNWTSANAAKAYHQGAIYYAQHESTINTFALLAVALFLLAGGIAAMNRQTRRALARISDLAPSRRSAKGRGRANGTGEGFSTPAWQWAYARLIARAFGRNLAGVDARGSVRNSSALVETRHVASNATPKPSFTRLAFLPWLRSWQISGLSYATLAAFIFQTILATGVSTPSYAQQAALNANTSAGLPIGTYYYITNHLGSSTVILDDLLNVVETNVYKPFGELWDDGDTSKPHRFYFTGAEKEEFDLYQFGARWYNPDLGRFISADSIVPDPADSQHFNRYSYADNNPINLIDPTGHSTLHSQMMMLGPGYSYYKSSEGTGVDLLTAFIIDYLSVIGVVAGFAGAAAAGGSLMSTSSAVTLAFSSASYSAVMSAMLSGGSGSAALIAFVSGLAGSGLGAAAKELGGAAQRTAQILGSMVIAGVATAISGGDVSMAVVLAGLQASVMAFAMAGDAAEAANQVAAELTELIKNNSSGIKLTSSPLERVETKGWFGRTKVSYRLTQEAKNILQSLFNKNIYARAVAFNISKIKYQFEKHLINDTPAYTIENKIYITQSYWDNLLPRGGFTAQLNLLAHEMTHSLQYQILGKFIFLRRYVPEYDPPESYIMPGTLVDTNIMLVNPINPNYTLDQIAERFAFEIR